MKGHLLYWLAGIIVLLVLAPAVLSMVSRFRIPPLGVRAGRLLPCPARPNCVCSEKQGKVSSVAPLRFSGESDRAWAMAVQTVQQMGGQVIHEEPGYLHAVFHSPVYRFIDDLELRLDRKQRVIHLRSAARSGYSDLGVNRKRAEQLQVLFRES
ncbi:MAG: DUF1499 domain-containing protein [Desulfobulbaceae bacterium]